MASRPKHAFCGGRIVPFSEAGVPLDDRGLLFSESLYEVAPITAGAPRLLAEHVERMRRAATELGLESGVPELVEWEHVVAELMALDGVKEGLLYAQLTGGAAPRDFVVLPRPAPSFFAYVTPFTYPRDADVVRGIRAVSLEDIRWGRRDLKTTMLLAAVLAKTEAKRRGATEAVLVGASGDVNEGASSNVFIVEGRALVTPRQSTNLLPGTMRPLVASVAAEAGLEVRREPFQLDRFFRADEAFITSTGQLAMPIVALDDRVIGSGRGGPVAQDLARRIRARFQLEE